MEFYIDAHQDYAALLKRVVPLLAQTLLLDLGPQWVPALPRQGPQVPQLVDGQQVKVKSVLALVSSQQPQALVQRIHLELQLKYSLLQLARIFLEV